MKKTESTEAAVATTTAPNPNAPRPVTLETPVQRGDSSITTVLVRKPRSGELRGLSLSELLQLNVDALQTVLPRITEPMLHKQDVANLDPADLVSLGSAVINFLLPKDQRADFQTA